MLASCCGSIRIDRPCGTESSVEWIESGIAAAISCFCEESHQLDRSVKGSIDSTMTTGRRRRCWCFLAVTALILISSEAAAAAGADDGTASILLSQSAAESMTFLGNASYGRTGQQIELTNPLPRYSNATRSSSSGRALYNVPLQMLNPATSFDTTFAFATSGGGGGGGGGSAAPSADASGLSFVIVPNNQDLGSAPSRHAFSVEFSSSSNTIGVWSGAEWVAAVNASFDLGGGSRSFGWIRYDCQARRIEVRASNLSAMPASPVIAQDLDLSTVFNEFMFVGFSASSSVASAAAKNTIYAWNFTSWIAKLSSAHPDPASLSAPSSSSSSSSSSRRGITAAGIAVVVVLAAIAVVALITRQIWRASSSKNAFTRADDNNAPSDQHSLLRRFSFKELVAATKNFAITEKLGGDESVSRCYRGVLSDSVVAVKIASKDPAFAQESQQLLAEMASLRHRNLARLLGWCSSDTLGSLLVYEFVPNGSLDQHLFKSEQGKQQQPPLPWSHRHKIACGLAQALEHLHARGIVHGNVKSSNVMLESGFSARLGDFGLGSSPTTRNLGHSSLVVAGTFGYVAPEAVQTGRLSKQSDVFAFGAVLLELACGRRALESEFDHVVVLVDLVRQQQQQQQIVDPKLGGLYDVSEMETLVRVGLVCSDTDPNARPSMEMVVKMLAGEASPPRLQIESEQQQQQQRPIEELLVMKDFGSLFSSSPSSSGDRLLV